MGLKILVVDDALFMRRMLSGILEEEKYEVIAEAQTGVEAIDQFQKCRPDITVLDIVMPEMTGIEALKAIKRIDAGAKVVICTAIGQEALRKEAMQCGALDYILKPFEPENVKAVMRKVAGL